MKRFMFRLLSTCSPTPSAESATKKIATVPGTFAAVTVFVFFISLLWIPAASAQEYQLNWAEDLWGGDDNSREMRARDINDSGVVVGRARHADRAFRFYFDHEANSPAWVTEDLNDLGARWTDLGGVETVNGWTAVDAEGINASGQIVGTASHPNYDDRVFVLSFDVSPPNFDLLPRFGTGDNVGEAINDAGIVVADDWGGSETYVLTPWDNYVGIGLGFGPGSVADINNFGVIVANNGVRALPDANSGPNYSYSPGVFNSFPIRRFMGVNDWGVICGDRETVGRGRNKINGGPIRIEVNNSGDIVEEITLQDGDAPIDWAGDINDFGDVCYTMNGTGFVYTDADGSLGLEQLVANPDADWLNFGSYMILKGINNSGQVCGQAGGNGKTFVLTPIVPGPTLSVNDLEINEGGNGTTTEGQFTVTLSELTGEDVTVPYVIHDGTATTGDDYTTIASSGLLTFAFSAGETSKTVEFTIVGDDTNEPDETFTIALGEAVGGATVASGTGTATIKNDDGGSAMYSSNDTPTNIRDRKNTFSTISIGDDYGIVGMTVNLDISHNRPSDLSATLIGPDGTETPLLNFSGNNDVIAFNDTSSLGDWTLKVRDNNRGETGTLSGWSITVDY